MKELLDTDRVNYLIWRYLLESNYRDTAAKLQKEWRVHQPHKQLDFAQHVKTYALVNLLNKGLHYEAFERQFAEREAPQDVPATAEATPWGVFGPLKFQPDPVVEEQQQIEEEDEDSEADAEYDEEPDIVMTENPRKRSSDRPHHALSHGSPAKRQRVNGYENGADSATTPMEIDHHPENNHAYPSPLEREQVVSPPPHHTDGPSRGTQVDKTKDLTQDTVFLRLGADNSAEASENPIVLISKWNPKNPSVLATGGTDTLARIWTLQSGSTPDSLPGHVDINSTFRNLNEGFPSDATVTSMAWTSNGEAVALGIEIGNKARLGVWTEDGEVIYRSDDSFDSPITNICWNPTDDLLLAISPDVTKGVANTGTLLHITSPASPDTKAFSRTLDYDLPSFPVDATWINENGFLICGRGLLASFRLADGEIQNVSNFTIGKDERFVFVKYDRRSNLVATASEAGYIDVWDASGQRRQIKAHDGAITAMQWQPQQAGTSDEERLLVSSGVDGTILLWNVLNPENKPKYSITLDSPLAASSLAITPDGTHIAAATHDRVLIWKLGEHSVPKAEWIPQSGWQTPKTESDADENNVSLEWDCIGEKLVYSMDNRLVVLKFR